MAERKRHLVTVVNPKRTRRKKASKKAGKKAGKKAATPMARRRRRRKSPATTAAPRRRRRSKRNPMSTRTRARIRGATRRGKYLGGFALNPMGPTSGMLARLAGKIVTVWCVRRWGNLSGLGPDAKFSQSTGQAWSFKGYFVAWLASYLGGEIVARAVGQKAGEDFYQGGIDLTATKLMWSELVQRWDPAREALGQAGSSGYSAQLSQLAMGATEGDILDDGGGNRWLLQNGRWTSMQGASAMGRLVEADYLGQEADEPDGYEEEDETQYTAGMGRLVEADYLGHMMPASSTTAEEAIPAQYLRRGSNDPYHAAYL